MDKNNKISSIFRPIWMYDYNYSVIEEKGISIINFNHEKNIGKKDKIVNSMFSSLRRAILFKKGFIISSEDRNTYFMKYIGQWNTNDLFMLLANRINELNYILYSCQEDIFELNLSEKLYAEISLNCLLSGT